jgi:hypothetical protein
MAPDHKPSSLDEKTDYLEEVVLEKTPWASSPDYLHDYMRAGLTHEDAQFLYDIPKSEQDRIFHKVDWRLCPMLAVLYLISHLDRANIGNAKIEGLEDTLNMSGTDYNVALMVFFVPYVLCGKLFPYMPIVNLGARANTIHRGTIQRNSG